MVEYTLILGMISMLLVGAFTLTPVESAFTARASEIAAAIPGGDETPTPAATPQSQPSSANDCKKGGWAAYGFKNQGACVSWVNTSS